MFPRLIEVLQEVGNLGQQAAHGESRWEVCLKMHKAAITIGGAASHTLTSDEVWLQVARSAKREPHVQIGDRWFGKVHPVVCRRVCRKVARNKRVRA